MRSPFRAALVGAGVDLPAGFVPALRLVYDRERFIDPASGARLSLDSGIAPVEVAPWTGFSRQGALGLLPLDTAIVEHKGPERELPAALAVLEALGARRGSFSKYAACLLHGSN